MKYLYTDEYIKMRKVEINNEIVLLRQCVRRARIYVINKLVREAKRLRSNHGNEKQLDKCKNKADKLLREVSMLKHVKDDEVLKFGIIRFNNLQTILQSPHVDDGSRAMAKVARHKLLSAKILEFHDKYPDYSEHISCTKKKVVHKMHEKKRKSTLNLKNGCSKLLPVTTNSGKENLNKEKKAPQRITPVRYVAQEKHAESKEDRKAKTTVPKEQTQNSGESESITKVINCQVAVKKFTDLLQEMELNEQNTSRVEVKHDQPANRRSECLSGANDFFLHVHNAFPHSNVSQCIQRTSTDRVLNVNYKSSTLYQMEDEKNVLNMKRVKREKTDCRRQRMYDKKVPEGQTGKNVLTSRYCKESKNFSVDKQKNLKSAEVLNNESLHPSWLAKKKQQDIMKQGFQGKKIKFDDD